TECPYQVNFEAPGLKKAFLSKGIIGKGCSGMRPCLLKNCLYNKEGYFLIGMAISVGSIFSNLSLVHCSDCEYLCNSSFVGWAPNCLKKRILGYLFWLVKDRLFPITTRVLSLKV